MSDKLIFILPGVVLIAFILNLWFKGNTIQSALTFILAALPLMDLKVTSEAWGGFKIFDAICFAALFLYIKDFTTINFRNRTNLYFVLFCFLSVTILLGGLASAFPARSYLALVKTVPIFIFGRFLMSACIKDPTFHLKAIFALKIALVSSLVFLALQLIIGLHFTFYPALGPNTVDPVFKIVRYPGVFYDSQAHGQFLAMGAFILLYMSQVQNIKRSWVNYLLFIMVVIAINLAGSRAAFGGMAIGLLVSFFITAKKYRMYGIVLLIIGYFALTLVSYDSTVLNRAQNFSEDLQFRSGLWQDALQIVKKNPLMGIGWGNYQEYVTRYDQDQYLEIEDGKLMYFDQPESGYLKIMVELGLLGFGIFILFLLAPLLKGLSSLIKKLVPQRTVFLMGGLLSWMVAFTTVYSIFDYRILVMVTCFIVLIVSHPRPEQIDTGGSNV